MSYIFKQKFDIRQLVNIPVEVKKVFVAELDECLSALYAGHLRLCNYQVQECVQTADFEDYFKNFQPHLLIINANYFGETGRLAKRVVNLMPQMEKIPIITLGLNLSSEHIKSLMAAGVASHIDRRFSRPEDIVFLANSLLNNF